MSKPTIKQILHTANGIKESAMLTDDERIAELERENKQLREALRKYGNHLPDCPARLTLGAPCTCGYTKVLGEGK